MATPDEGRQRAHDITRELRRRAEHDPAFQAQYQQDPVGTLLAAGLPQEAIADALLEAGIDQADVQGYLAGLPDLTPGPGVTLQDRFRPGPDAAGGPATSA